MATDDLDSITFTDLSRFTRKAEVPPYPLVGIVGQQVIKKTLLLLVTNPAIGNMLLIGKAGTGKSTAARGLRDLLPEIEAVSGCSYNCDPRDKTHFCQDCKSSVADLNAFTRRIPLLELPIGASESRIFGGFDSQSRLRPGFVGQANRGFLILSRANLLEPDVLGRIMDISEAGTHRNRSEHGDFTHPAKFNIIATLNPEDGELDAEVMDRFSMAVKVQSIKDIEERIEIVRRVEAYRQDPTVFVSRNRREMEAFGERIKRARDLVNRVDIPKKVEATIGKVLREMGQDTEPVRHAIREAAQANAAFGDRVWVTVDDVAEVAELVLGHRGK